MPVPSRFASLANSHELDRQEYSIDHEGSLKLSEQKSSSLNFNGVIQTIRTELDSLSMPI